MRYIIDTFAWIEYFIGSNKGKVLKKIMDNKKNKIVTMECCLSELKGYCLREELPYNQLEKMVKRNSIIFPVLIQQWLDAAQIRFDLRKERKRFGLVDSILVAMQKDLKAKIVSGDPHFKGLPNVIFLE